MALSCHHCLRNIDFPGEQPSFCPYCGQSLACSTVSTDSLTERDLDETADFHRLEVTAAMVVSAPLTIRLPESVGGYRLIRKLGQGGMGSVHEAEDSTSGRRVAVKLIAPEHTASAIAVERFLQEGRLASAITHPRCVFVLAADQSEGWPFIVMELMPGHTLKDLVETQGPLPQGEAVRKIMDVIEGLEEAHKLGVIHRDVKPSNCFLEAEGRVKVGDFGLSKSLIGSDADLTRTGSFLGTPHYASPEQIKGEPIDARSDVYSVAATLYFLLTGKPPHHANDAAVALARIVSDDAPAIRTLRPEVWSALDEVVMRGLERDRKRRYRSLEEFREALAPFLPGRVALGRFGLRAGAYAIDWLILAILINLSLVATIEIIGDRPFYRLTQLRFHTWHIEWISSLVWFAYFGLCEVFGPATLGKRILRLRVTSITRGGPASKGEAIVRVLVFAAIVMLPRKLFATFLGLTDQNSVEFVSIESGVQILSVVLLLVTARASNGYRGIHELLSGTAVVGLPGKFRRQWGRNRPEPSPLTLLEVRPDQMPRMLGTFAIRGALVWTSERRLLLGEDSGLGRPVWIVLRPPGEAPESRARRDVGRIARPRWLAAGEHDGWSWEAFVAPGGHPLPHFVRPGHGLEWPEVRSLLDDLAAELDAACDDATLPEGLALDRVWVQPDGRVLLLDRPLDPLAGPAAEIASGDPQERALELLRQVAICGLSGKTPGDPAQPTPVGAPVPGHAIDGLARLCRLSAPYTNVAQFRADLEATRNLGPELSRVQLFGYAAYKLLVTELKALLPSTIVVLFFIALTVLSGSEIEIPDEDVIDRVLIIQSTFWVLVAMLLRQGVGGMLFGLTIIRADGRPATRLRLAWREAVVWLPLLIADPLFEFLPADGWLRWVRFLGTPAVAILIPVVLVVHFLLVRGRFLNDRLAGTAVVPR
jgi:eukaryotic-like serine/threonine-protein kinase